MIEPTGRVLAMVRIPVATFDSGDANRDSHMREALEAARYPYAVFKGVSSIPASRPAGAPLAVTLAGELDFHGLKRRIEVPVSIAMPTAVNYGGCNACHGEGGGGGD